MKTPPALGKVHLKAVPEKAVPEKAVRKGEMDRSCSALPPHKPGDSFSRYIDQLSPDTRRPPLIVVGATGGDFDAIKSVLVGLQSLPSGILVAQQTSSTFERQYLQMLGEVAHINILLAEDGQRISPGRILLAPTDRDIEIVIRQGHYVCMLSARESQSTPGTGPTPSLDKLFCSLAEQAGSMGIGVLLLGAGSEGTKGLSRLRRVGASVLVQENDRSSEPVTPTAAILNGGSEVIVPLTSIATRVSRMIGDPHRSFGTQAQ